MSLIRERWPNMEIFRHTFVFSGSSIWNYLTYEIQNSTSIQQFKGNMFGAHILHFSLSKRNVHAAIPGVSAQDTLLLSKLIHFVIIVSMLRNIW